MTSTYRATVAIGIALAACGKGGSKGATHEKVGPVVAGPGAGGSSATAKPAKNDPPRAASRGPERSVYSLVDNRLSAHLLRGGGLVVAGGSVTFAKYTRFGNLERTKQLAWDTRKPEGDVRVARITGRSAPVVVPLTAVELAGNPMIRVRAFASTKQAFAVRVNSNKDVTRELEAGWSTVELSPPADQFREGENELQFFTGKGGVAVEWIQVGGSAPAANATVFYDPAAKALVLPDGGGMAWYVMVPDKGVLVGDLADGSCKVSVKATAADTVVDGELVGLGSAVDLSSLAGKAVRLELIGRGCPDAHLTGAALVVPGSEPTPNRGEPPKYVVLFVMDSLRADRVRPWNSKARPEVPTFEKLAETSAVFLQHYVQGNESRVSHASLWSSLYPIKHSMIAPKDKLDRKWTTIDEVAKAAGKYVAGASANGYVMPERWGFGTAWDAYSNHIDEELGLKAEDILEKGLKFVGNRKEPWFLYLGTVDTHVSWRAKEPWISKYDPGYRGNYAEVFSGGDAAKAATGKGNSLTEAEIRHVRALYDSNVSSQDEVLGRLVAKLEEAGIWDQTLLIVTADHGDEQWEDGRVGHGSSTRDMLVHVPLLVRYPPLVKAGRYSEGTELVDIVPTVADALGVQLDAEWQGQSLIPLTQGVGAGYPRMSMTSQYEDAHGARIGQWKVRTKGAMTSGVFDMVADPDEMKPLTGASIGARVVLDPLWLLRTFNFDWKKSQWGNAANVTARFGQDLGE